MIETEAKIRLDESEFQDLYKRFGSPDFVLQRNWGYFTSNGYVRVREEDGKKYITLKEKIDGSDISREEIEFEISDSYLAREMFKGLGLLEEYYYEKKRASINKSDCVVCLDRITKIGDFVEVEGKEKDITLVLKEFGLSNKSFERRSYFEMVRGGTVSIDSIFG